MAKPLMKQHEDLALHTASEMLIAASGGQFVIGSELGEEIGKAVRAAFAAIEGAPEETPIDAIQNALDEIKASQSLAGRP